MTYEEFIFTKIVNKDIENYELLLESVLQTSIAPSTYLTGKLSKQKVSIGLLNLFGEQQHKAKNTSFNFYFLKQYREEVLKINKDSIKTCSSCKLELPIDNFYANGYQPSGKKKYKSKCKNCQIAQNDSRKDLLVLEIFGSYSCKICGYSKCRQALECHHIDPSIKEYEISNLNSCNKDIILQELKKCILVCANCHREIHYGMHPEYII